MNYKIKWVSMEEYIEIIQEHEKTITYPSGMVAMDLTKSKEYALMTFHSITGEPILIKLVESELMKQLL